MRVARLKKKKIPDAMATVFLSVRGYDPPSRNLEPTALRSNKAGNFWGCKPLMHCVMFEEMNQTD